MRAYFPKTAAQSQAETTHMARRLFASPRPTRIVVPILAFGVMEGYLLTFPSLDPWTVLAAAAAILVPAALTIGLTTPLAEGLGGRLPIRRSVLLTFIGLMLLGGFLLVTVVGVTAYAVFTGTPFSFPLVSVAIIGYGAVLWVRQVILTATSNSSYARSLPAAVVHPGLGLAGLWFLAPFGLVDLVAALVVYAIFSATAIAYTEIAKRPLMRSFGVDGLKLLRHTLDHYVELEDAGVAELEGFFESVSTPARVRIPGIAFRSRRGMKALLLAPSVHPGPMGYVGGSDLPTKVASGLRDVTPHVLVAHGPTTHDDNPATTTEVRRIPEAILRALPRLSFTPHAGSPVRIQSGRASVLAQVLGGTVVLVASFAPNPTDDIDGAVGHAVVQEARLAGADDAFLIDAHNCLEPGAGLTHFGSSESHELLAAARIATEKALGPALGPLRVGLGTRAGFSSPDQGLGARGIEALVVEAGGAKTAYVLFDGNNMVPGLRDEIRSRIGHLVQESEILTTDNHSVNLTMQGFNAVGAALDRAIILEQAEGAVAEAVKDLEDAEAAVVSAEILDFRIFGPQSASRLTTSINATMSVLRPALFLALPGAIAAATLVFVLV